MSFDTRRSGDSSPTDSGIDTRDWEENQKGMLKLLMFKVLLLLLLLI